ncbi:MAG: hypothetical protein JRH01_13245 [Deltaproteobacteria bacterium]|nr:hypothetical protein [Deltaproteobacteria bacterium]MBW2421140.1 hypothetical protein [Deltaproteobacteria bacterium]
MTDAARCTPGSEMMALEKRIEQLLFEHGATTVGFATTETLAGGPPSTDLEYVLPGARSAVCFTMPMDLDNVRPYLGKETPVPEQEPNELYVVIDKISQEVADLLIEGGHEAVAVAANWESRPEDPDFFYEPVPPLSHRYIAVASGAASFGWSGNVGIKGGQGSNVLLGTCVTSAELAPTQPVLEDEGFCDECKMCVASCPVEMFDETEEQSVTMGGRTFSYSKRVDVVRCMICCAGLTGMHKSGKWGSWSPGRFVLPEEKEETREAYREAAKRSRSRPIHSSLLVKVNDWGEDHPLTGAQIYGSCGVCQRVCHGNRPDRAKNVKVLRRSGVVVQRTDGSLEAMKPQEAATAVEGMDPERKKMYDW